MGSRRYFFACLLVPVSLAAQGAHTPGVTVRKLNAPLPTVPIGRIDSARLGPDGARVFYLADNEVLDVFELESALLDGSAPAVELGAPLVPGGRIASYVVSPDSSFVVYRVGRDELNTYELYRVSSDGSTGPVAVVGSRVATSSVGVAYAISAGGARIVYIADEGADGSYALYSVSADGSSGFVELNGPLSGGADVQRFVLSPDGAHVVYGSNELGGTNIEAFVVPIAGGTLPLQLSTLGGSVSDLWISPDSSRALYRAAGELYSVPLDGSQAPVRIDTLGGVNFDVRISSDSARAVYMDSGQRLHSAPLDGSSPAVQLWSFASAFRVDPAAQRVVFSAGVFPSGFIIYSVSIDGSAPPLELSGASSPPDFQITASGAWVVYKVAGMSAALFSVPTSGFAAPLPLDPSGLARVFFLAPDGKRVFFSRESSDPDQAGLYVVNTNGVGGARRISDSVPSPDVGVLIGPRAPDVRSGRFRRASVTEQHRVVFKAIRDVPSVAELFGVVQDGSSAPARLSAPFLATEIRHDVDAFLVEGPWAAYGITNHSNSESVFRAGLRPTPPAAEVGGARAEPAGIDLVSGRLLYLQLVGTRQQLFSRPLDLSTPGVQLSQLDPVLGEVTVTGQAIDSLGIRVAYSVEFSDATQGLYTVCIDGSEAPVRLSESLTNARIGSDFRFSLDGTRIFFRERHTGGFALYSSPSDLRDAVELNAPLPNGSNVESFSLGAGRVVYRADQDVFARPELFSVPLDGSASPVKLNLTPVNRVQLFELAPDGTRVVYTAAQTSSGPVQLYGVSILGGASTQLNATLVLAGSVQSFRIAPEGARVAYLADGLQNDRFELFGVPIDGSQPAQKLSGTIPAGSDVQDDFQIGRDGAWVGYRVRDFGVAELFVAPIDGSSAPRRLNATLPIGASVDQFAIAPDGQRVVYLADQVTPDTLELFLVPLRGGADPVRLNGELAFGGDVDQFVRFQITPDSRGVVYCATQDVSTAIELYLASFPRPLGPGSLSGH